MEIQKKESQNSQMQPTILQTSVLNSLSREEKQLVTIEFSSDKIGTFDAERKKELAKHLVKMSFFVGIKEPLSNEELKMVVNFLCTQMPTITIEKIEDAFMKVSAGQLGFIEHFQSFSPSYIAKVIRAYESLSKPALTKYFRNLEKIRYEEESREKAKNYDSIQGVIDALKTELKKHHAKHLDEFSAFDDFQSRLVMELCQKIGLFHKYDKNEIEEKKFLRNFFKYILKNQKDEEQAIESYVRTKETKTKQSNGK